MQQDCEVLTCT